MLLGLLLTFLRNKSSLRFPTMYCTYQPWTNKLYTPKQNA